MTDDPTPGFPAEGRSAEDLLAAIRAGRGDDADWRGGRTFSLVYDAADPGLEALQEAVAHEYLHENYLNPFAFPSLLQMEREVVAMGADLLGGDAPGRQADERRHREPVPGRAGGPRPRPPGPRHRRAGHRDPRRRPTPPSPRPATTSTSTRCGCRSARRAGRRGRHRAGARRRGGGAGGAGRGLGPLLPVRRRRPHPRHWRELAAGRGVLCHVDACLGGWLLPFLERLGEPIPPWDMRVPGVTSLSADIHKYGWSFKGASLLLHARDELLRHQYFLFDGWPGGLYGSATTAGTRPAAPIAAAWATVNYLGEAGYLRLTAQVPRRRPAAAGRASRPSTACTSPATRCRGSWRWRPTTGGPDLAAVADVMDDRGWHLDRQQGGLHAIVSPSHVAVADRFLADLADAVATHGAEPGRRGHLRRGRGDRPQALPFGGAVLCGGASRRMGTDKALLAVGRQPMALRVTIALQLAGAPVGRGRRRRHRTPSPPSACGSCPTSARGRGRSRPSPPRCAPSGAR